VSDSIHSSSSSFPSQTEVCATEGQSFSSSTQWASPCGAVCWAHHDAPLQ
jgi:hypothetical protein